LLLAGTIAVATGATFHITPHFAIENTKKAVGTKDIDALSGHIDYRAFKASQKGDISPLIGDGIGTDEELNPFRFPGASFAAVLPEPDRNSGTVCEQGKKTSEDVSQPYLFDLLKNPSYRKSWGELFKGERNIDRWLATYARTKDGPATPRRFISSDGIMYETSTVCKTHDCGRNIFFIIFAPNGSRAWGLLLKNNTHERFFGNPSENQKQLLRAMEK